MARSPWASKLYNEALLLGALGVLDDAGDLRCPECGSPIERNIGWSLYLHCDCGWSLQDAA